MTNVINLSVPWVLQPVAAGGGLTLRVAASYEVKGPRTLALAFEWARVGELRISDLLQGLLAPAVLPRTPLQHELLMRLQEAALEVRACLRVGPVGSVKPRSCVNQGTRNACFYWLGGGDRESLSLVWVLASVAYRQTSGCVAARDTVAPSRLRHGYTHIPFCLSAGAASGRRGDGAAAGAVRRDGVPADVSGRRHAHRARGGQRRQLHLRAHGVVACVVSVDIKEQR